jgi:bacterioferritin
MGIAFSEMHHLEILGEVLLQAGIEPIYAEYLPFGCNFYKSDVVSYSKTAGKMLLDDISGELVAIDSYEKAILSIANEEVKAVLTRIKLDEELHVKVLKERLEKYCEKEKIFNT